MESRVLDEAADWLMRLHDGDVSDADRAACERWRKAHVDHAMAWERAELLMGKLGGLPAALAMPVLQRADRSGRRAAVAKLAALLAIVPAGWLGWKVSEGQGWTADLHAATGEQRESVLPDGSRLVLDTASAVNIAFDAQFRTVHLLRGALFVETAADASGAHRPFVVATAQGRLRALGTQFTVRQTDAGAIHLAVSEGAVEVTLRGAASPALIVPAGQQTVLTAQGVEPLQAAPPEVQAWVHGMLMADAMPLAEVCAELSRYCTGVLSCAPEVARIKVSGAYPLTDIDRTLGMLASTYPVQVHTRFRGLWITVTAS